ncbi:MAG: penicillin-binding transpeptidase domain-containing protein [Lachnospiraceae bacterium]|nr:penicillin-binding transpeptidase domain-containing protein [Lachnospiraceae bacterium]
MNGYYLHHRKKVTICIFVVALVAFLLIVRLFYIMVFQSLEYEQKAADLHERQREIKAPRGKIYDRNGVELASNRSVCTISVIHNQITDSQKVISVLSEYLDISEEEIRKKVEKVSVREKIKSNVDKEVAEKIRAYKLDGVMIDEDYKRYYPYDSLASKVLGFTGADNQGIVGLEVQYESVLAGEPGYILTLTDAYGHRVKNSAESRQEAVAGDNLITSLDLNIQKYAEQAAEKVCKEKNAKSASVIVCNPQNGEIYACVNVPEYHLNDPYQLGEDVDTTGMSAEKKQELVNQMWRNTTVNDTYEPGSTFKIVTATAALEEGVVKVDDTFQCPGYKVVEDRRIRCHKRGGHGTETFREGVMNSCNPVFMEVGARVGASNMYKYYKRLGLFEKTGIDLPGEANSIMHNLKDVGAVELATMSFGQSFQITPFQLIRAVSAVVNGGTLVTPHFGVAVEDSETGEQKRISYNTKTGAVSQQTSQTMRELLEAVVSEGSGRNAKVSGYAIGGKTATSEKLPRGNGKYISSFLGFAPTDNPTVMVLLLINEPEGIYYGGTIAAPVVGDLLKNIMPYLGIEKTRPEEEDTKETIYYITD